MIVMDYNSLHKDHPLDSELVPDFVDFSRIEHRQLPLTERPNQLADLGFISPLLNSCANASKASTDGYYLHHRVVIGNRAVYFLFLKNLFSGCLEQYQLSFIFGILNLRLQCR